MEIGFLIFVLIIAFIIWRLLLRSEGRIQRFVQKKEGTPRSGIAAWVRARFTPGQRLGLGLTIGLLVSLFAAFIFGELADAIVEQDIITQYDLSIGRYLLGGMSLVGSRLFYLITQLGSVLFLIPAFLLMCYWLWSQRRQKDILIYTIAVGGGALINLILKSLFGRVRPDFTNAFYHEIGYSFPSGHAMMSMLFYGMTVFLLIQSIKSYRVKTAVLVAGAALILLVGFSRLTLGVHFLSDVVGGWAAGSVWLVTCIALREFTWL